MGLEPPGPGRGVFQTKFLVALHSAGSAFERIIAKLGVTDRTQAAVLVARANPA